MKKTTVYLPDELVHRLRRASEASGRSEADLIREGIAKVVDEAAVVPTLPLFDTGDGTIARRVEELLDEGFGELDPA
jgi:Arc/MetJ-type ribon-helix-helix transcriptional regulator